ncbi:MAG: carboxypeptidase-like regulatory domain-containing protein, partial [Sphingobacteriales bacterium]
MIGKDICLKIFILIALLFSSIASFAQITKVSGVIIDAKTRQTLPFVTIGTEDGTAGVTSAEDGKYELQSDKPFSKIIVSYVGYQQAELAVTPGQEQVLNIRLVPVSRQLTEVVIKAGKKTRYRNKDNPAVKLIREVIAHRDQNRAESYPYVQYKEYDKMMFSLLNVSPTLSDKKFFRKYKFLLDNRDTTSVPGKSLLPIYLDEKLSQYYY